MALNKMSAIIFIILFSLSAQAETYRIGPTHEHETLSSVINRLQAGDEVLIEPGVYREVMKIKAKGTPEKPVVIRGIAGKERPVFNAEGINVSGRGSIPRAIFQIEGSNIIIEHLEFKNARNGNNGAGIRPLNSENLVIRDCKIHHCDMGIQGGDRNAVLIEACDIGFNGSPQHNGYSHNFYMLGNKVIVRRCYIHDSLYGQNYKSRAHYNELWYNWIVDSNEGEVGPVDGEGATDRPNSNVLMVGNVIVSKPNRTGNNAKYILVGSELGGSHDGTLFMFFNVCIAGTQKIQFIQLDDPKTNAVVNYNIFYGSPQILTRRYAQSTVKGSHNWIQEGASIPTDFKESIIGDHPGFQDISNRDFRLNKDSPLWQYENETIHYTNGDGVEQSKQLDLKSIQQNWHSKVFTRLSDYKAYE